MQALLILTFVAVLVLQALRPQLRLELVLGGAGVCLGLSAWAGHDVHAVLTRLPWDVLVILAALGVVSRLVADSQLFVRLAVKGTQMSRASPTALVAGAAVPMFFISSLVNNLTALLLVLPVVIAILELVGTTERHLRWTVGTLLVACNLGGAATPIGDFPAILLLGAGALDFVTYLKFAFPTALVALVVLLVIVHGVVRPARDVVAPALRRELTVNAVEALHRRIAIDWRVLIPSLLVLGGMLAAWTLTRVPPHLVAWLGAVLALLLVGRRARGAALRGIDVEATLFLFGLFVLVGAVRESGAFTSLAHAIGALPITDDLRLLLVVTVTGVATGLFSAGPSMAAMMEVAQPLATTITPAAVYVGLAFGVCAGSSLLLTAATSGPLAQALVERAAIVDDHGRRVRFTFQSFIPVGAVAFTVILLCGLVAAVWIAA